MWEHWSCRDGVKRPKAHLQLNLARDVKGDCKSDLQELQAPEITREVQSKEYLPLVEEEQVREQ